VVDSIPQSLDDEWVFFHHASIANLISNHIKLFEFLPVIAMGGIRSFNLWMMKWVFFPHDTALTF
jgi:hypothetical protein